MSTHFDPEQGTLRVRHGALAVLALLATDPTSVRLHDHDVAPPLAELRAAGLLDGRGIHPEVAPLAETIGAARTTADLRAHDHGTPRYARCWVGEALAVVGVADGTDPHAYELMADARARVPDLLGELVGLGAAPPASHAARALAADAFDRLVAAGVSVGEDDVARAIDRAGAAAPEPASRAPDPFVAGLTAALRGAAVRWRLVANRRHAEAPVIDIDVLDAGQAGLWLGHRAHGEVRIGPVEPAAVRSALAPLAE